MRVLRVSAFEDQRSVAQVEVVAICDDGRQRTFRFSFSDPVQLGEAAEKMRRVSTEMLRFAPRTG